LTLHATGTADQVVKAVGRLGIAQSTIDLLRKTAFQQRAAHRDDFAQTLPTNDGDSIESLINWISQNCDVLSYSPNNIPADHDTQELREKLGPETWDTILVAAEPGRCLYSDDLRVRGIGASEYRIRCVSTYPLLALLVKQNAIENEVFVQAVVAMASAGYITIPINAEVLHAAATQFQWTAMPRFLTILKLLHGGMCTGDSAVTVVGAFLRIIWENAVLTPSRDRLLFRVFDHLAINRNPEWVFTALQNVISEAFLVIPSAQDEFLQLAQQWFESRLN